jgi:hypothetical protein
LPLSSAVTPGFFVFNVPLRKIMSAFLMVARASIIPEPQIPVGSILLMVSN